MHAISITKTHLMPGHLASAMEYMSQFLADSIASQSPKGTVLTITLMLLLDVQGQKEGGSAQAQAPKLKSSAPAQGQVIADCHIFCC